MNLVTISCIVEGHGEVAAVPILIRRIAQRVAPYTAIAVPRPFRLPRTKVKSPDLEHAIGLAKVEVNGNGGILILMDADEDPPCILGPEIQTRATQIAGAIPIGVVLAKVEYEAWFLASAASLAGKCGLPVNLVPPNDPESVSAAKGWLDQHMPRSRKYSETLDQPTLTANFDIDAALTAPSFDKCYREVTRLLELGQASALVAEEA